MAKVWTLGLSKIELGEAAVDGGMGTTLSALGFTYQGTANLTTEEPTETEHYAEEVDDPQIILEQPGKTILNFSIMDADFSVMQALIGGTITGEGAAEQYNAPNAVSNIEKSIKVSPKQGHIINIPRAKISARYNGDLAKTGIMLLEVKATVLTLTKDGVSKVFYTR